MGKSCGDCKELLPLTAFQPISKKGWQGHAPRCRQCSTKREIIKRLGSLPAGWKYTPRPSRTNPEFQPRDNCRKCSHCLTVKAWPDEFYGQGGQCKHCTGQKQLAARQLPERRASRNQCERKRRQDSDIARITHNLRTRLTKAVTRARATKHKGTLDLIGCSVSELHAHISSLFVGSMSWDNYGSFWHIDHIKPLAAFDLHNPAELAASMHFSNLQPLTIRDNCSKGSMLPDGIRARYT